MEQGHTWFAEREEGFQTSVSQPPSTPRDDCTTATPPWILRDNGSKGKKVLRNEGFERKRKRMGLEKDEE